MMPAEKWLEYQESYQDYGIDMRPVTEFKRTTPKKKQATITAKDKTLLIALTVLVGIVCIGMIISTAYTAKVKYEINAMIKETAAIENDIENLQVKIKQSANITTVENRATSELGMVYPTFGQYVYLEEIQAVNNYAQMVKENTYELW